VRTLYPEPPHLTIAVWSDQSEDVTFAKLCELVQRHGCVPLNRVQTVPRDRTFEWISDLADVMSEVDTDRAGFADLVVGADPARRPVRAGFSHKKFGTVLVEYLGAPAGERHPMAVSLGAGALGLPEQLWSRADRSAADKIVRWSKAILEDMTETNPVRYGAIGVEFTLATPAHLGDDSLGLTTELFVSGELLATAPAVDAGLRDLFGAVGLTEWRKGLFVAGWAPFNERHVSIDDLAEARRRCRQLLARAVRLR
jgi:hypothetical protein